jgi:hypothetical protein
MGARGGRMMERGWWFVGGCSKILSHNQTLFREFKDNKITDARSRRCVHEPIGECVWLQHEHCS